MNINAPILLHHLKRYFRVEYARYEGNNPVRTPILYSVFFETDQHIVLVHYADLIPCLARTQHSVVVCLDFAADEVPTATLNDLDLHTNDLIVLNDSLAETMAFNILNHILDQFNLWENAMNEILHNTHSFLDMVNTISNLLDLPVALTDTNFRYIAYSDNSTDYMSFVDSENQVSIEVTNRLLADPEFKRLEEHKQAFTYHATETAVYKNIFSHGIYVGRIACLMPDSPDKADPFSPEASENESVDELIDYYKSVFNRAASFIEILYAQSDSFENTAIKYQQILLNLTKIVNREYVNIREFDMLLQEQGSRTTDTYVTFVLMLQDGSKSFYSPTYICTQIEHLLPGSYAIWNSNKIIVLSNVSQYERMQPEPVKLRFENLLRQLRILTGHSRGFCGITASQTVYTAYLQAEYALAKGMQADKPTTKGSGSLQSETANAQPPIWNFDDYALDYILTKGAAGLSAEQICHPALLYLAAHDKKHQTSYIKTLRAYGESGYNAAATARMLFIHRSSFLGRMDRIGELVDLDMENPWERLYLGVSFRLFFNGDKLLG